MSQQCFAGVSANTRTAFGKACAGGPSKHRKSIVLTVSSLDFFGMAWSLHGRSPLRLRTPLTHAADASPSRTPSIASRARIADQRRRSVFLRSGGWTVATLPETRYSTRAQSLDGTTRGGRAVPGLRTMMVLAAAMAAMVPAVAAIAAIAAMAAMAAMAAIAAAQRLPAMAASHGGLPMRVRPQAQALAEMPLLPLPLAFRPPPGPCCIPRPASRVRCPCQRQGGQRRQSSAPAGAASRNNPERLRDESSRTSCAQPLPWPCSRAASGGRARSTPADAES